MNTQGACTKCKGARHRHKSWQPIGEPVVTHTTIGRGYDQTEHKFFQCSECGSVWVEYEDNGAGGHDTLIKLLTEGLF
jgi:hypothetical protein